MRRRYMPIRICDLDGLARALILVERQVRRTGGNSDSFELRVRRLGRDLEGDDIDSTAARVAENETIADLSRIRMLPYVRCRLKTNSTHLEKLCLTSLKMLNGKI